MTTKSKPTTSSSEDPRGRTTTVPQASNITSAADAEIDKSSVRSKQATSRISIVLRAILFGAACIFAIVGVMGLINASGTQSTTRSVTTDAVKAPPQRHACVIFSYDDSDPIVAYERDGLLQVLDASGVSSDLFYLDARATSHIAGSKAREADKILQKGLLTGGYDVVVAVGDEALSFVNEQQDLFDGVPAAFFAVDDKSIADKAFSSGYATGYLEQGAAALSLEEACKLVPQAKRVVVLEDGSAEAKGQLQQLKDASPSISMETWNASTMTREKLGNDLSGLGSDAIVLLLAANQDSDHNVYTPSETAAFVSEHCPVPVFSAFGGVGEGVCGSAFFDRQTEGSDTAVVAINLLNGQEISSTPVVTVDPMSTVFDSKALQAHGINPDSIPDGSVIINESLFSWRVIRPLAIPILFLIAAVVCIVVFGVIGFRRSIASSKAITSSYNDLKHRLYHDLLTELPNRHAVDLFVSDESTRSQMKALALIDINDFTDVNDSYGQAFGNEVIKIMAERLQRVESILLARSGGDEFTLAFDHALEPGSPELQHIERIFADPIVLGDNKVDLSAKVGIVNVEDDMTSEDIIAFSDLAVHFAKLNNEMHPVFYEQSMRDEMERKLEITAYLKEAIANEAIYVVWQPQVETETLKVAGYEALCRLEGDPYYPGDFIPVAEMSGLINPLDRLMTKKVIVQMGQWLKEGRKVAPTAINFSAAQLRDKGYCDFLAELLAENDVPPALLKIEITESMIIGNEEEAEKLFKRLRSMGILLALDDFGTGYSSLYRMAIRPIDIVKLDKSLVDNFMLPGKNGFIDDITRLIHGLDKVIVVEGVETYEQYQMCQQFGCDIIQGYYFAKPLLAADAIDFDPKSVLP